MSGPYAISPRTSPTVCPRCGHGVELSFCLLAPHNVRPVGGNTCDGSGLTPVLVPLWPGTVKFSRPRTLRILTPRTGSQRESQPRHSTARDAGSTLQPLTGPATSPLL